MFTISLPHPLSISYHFLLSSAIVCKIPYDTEFDDAYHIAYVIRK